MKMLNRIITITHCMFIALCLVLAGLFTAHSAMAQTALSTANKGTASADETAKKPPPPAGPIDEYDRGTPRSSVSGFLKAARDGNYKGAAQYLDLSKLPVPMDKNEGPELARQLKIVLDRALWVDLELLSNHPKGNWEDGLPANREIIGRINTPDETVDILLQRVPRKDDVYIWKFSNRTVAKIPDLYAHFGYRPFEEALSKLFPDWVFLGWHAWQWVACLLFLGLGYLVALVPAWIAALLLGRRDTDLSRELAKFSSGPLRIVLWLLLVRISLQIIGPSVAIRSLLKAGTVMIFAFGWALIRLVDLVFEWWANRLRKSGQESTVVLLQPVKTIIKITIGLLATLVWLDNIEFDVATILAGLGVGGIAIALAAQDTLKNFFGSIMILLDKPYNVGQRIVIKGHDGVVEEIGLRSTKIRLLNGHQTTVPNEQMAGTDIENIGRRPHIRRLTNIAITYDTPPEKIEKAVNFIRKILDNHEGTDPEFPPQVYFNEFNPASLNIIMLYWYHPPLYWDYLAFNQRVNLQIMQEFEKEGIEFAFPTTTTYLAQDTEKPLQVKIAGGPQLESQGEMV